MHDLHVWELTSGFPALSAHVLVLIPPHTDWDGKRRELQTLLKDRYGIEHVTLQVEHEPGALHIHSPEADGRASL